MNGKKRTFGIMFLLAGLLLVGLIVLNGCKKSEPAAAIEQTVCPIMGGAINKSMFTEYKGKKVYFCCAGCKPTFEKNPEKYIAKLPQFCKEKADANKGEGMSKVLKITWQRLIDEKGQTCQRCGSTEKELQKALQSLKKSLAPLGIKVALEKKTLDPVTVAKDISQSNRIWVGERTLEEWLGAQVGKSLCGFCCAELGEQVECRTVKVEGKVYETIPANLIVRAGLLAAAGLYGESSTKSCCPGGSSVKTDIPPCCPTFSDRPEGNSNK